MATSLSSLSLRPNPLFLPRLPRLPLPHRIPIPTSLSFPLSSPHSRLTLRCTPPDSNPPPTPTPNDEDEQETPAGTGFFEGPLFDWPEETEEETAIAFEKLYGPSFSGETYLGGNIYEMDSEISKIIDEFDNVIVQRPSDDFEERVVEVRRVTKVVKGGKNMSFRAVVVVGDKKGHVGVGVGKALEVSEAVIKAVINGRRNIVTVPLTKHLTFPHRANGRFRAAEVMLRPAAPGSGVIAGGAVRIVLELAGLKNALGKQLGSYNALNNARATIAATQQMRHIADVARERGIPLEEMYK